MSRIKAALFTRTVACPACGFTDFKEDFFDPGRSRENRAPLIAPRPKAEAARRGAPVGILREGLRPVLPTRSRG